MFCDFSLFVNWSTPWLCWCIVCLLFPRSVRLVRLIKLTPNNCRKFQTISISIQFQFNFNGPQLWQLFRYDSELRTRFEFDQEGEAVRGGIVQIHMRSFRVANYSRANWHNRSHITRRVQRAACSVWKRCAESGAAALKISAAWLSFSLNSDIEQGGARPAKHLTKVIFPLGPTLSGLLKTTRRCLPQNVACLTSTTALPRLALSRRIDRRSSATFA